MTADELKDMRKGLKAGERRQFIALIHSAEKFFMRVIEVSRTRHWIRDEEITMDEFLDAYGELKGDQSKTDNLEADAAHSPLAKQK